SVNDGGASEYSAIRSFTTVPAIAGVPTLISPADEATLVELDESLTWSEVDGALSYDVQVSTDNFFADVSPINVTEGTSYQLSGLENETVYYWRVRSVNDGGASEYSAIRSFTTEPAIAGVPTLISPANESTLVVMDQKHNWNGIHEAMYYHFQIAKDTKFANL